MALRNMSKSSGSKSHSTSLRCTSVKTDIDIDPDVHSVRIDRGWSLPMPCSASGNTNSRGGKGLIWCPFLSVVQPLFQGGENLSWRAFDLAVPKGSTFITSSFIICSLTDVSHRSFCFGSMQIRTATHSCWQKTPKEFFNTAENLTQSMCHVFPLNYLGSHVFMFLSLWGECAGSRKGMYTWRELERERVLLLAPLCSPLSCLSARLSD